MNKIGMGIGNRSVVFAIFVMSWLCCENPNTSTGERRECMDEGQPPGRG